MAAEEALKPCSAGERAVLDMVRAWPGVPATVTFCPDGNWSVETEKVHADAYLRGRSARS